MLPNVEKQPSKYEKLFQKLFGDIMSGFYSPGERIPNEVDLAKSNNVSRPTASKAIKELELKGLVTRRPGAGTFVCRPDVVAQQKIGLLMPRRIISPDNYGHFVSLGGMIVSEISRRANADNHVLLLNDLPHGHEKQVLQQCNKICKQLIDMQVKGVFFLPFEFSQENRHANFEIAEKFRTAGIAVTLIDRDVYNDGTRSNFDIVSIDNERASFELTEHLIKNGNKKIKFVVSKVKVSSITERIMGFKRALEKYGLDYSAESVCQLPFLPFIEADKHLQDTSVKKLIRDSYDQAYVCVNDRLASILMTNALEMGKKIPKDIKITGFDDEPFGAYLPVPLTTMRQPALALAAEAMRTLVSRGLEPDIPPRDINLKAQLIVRESCGCSEAATIPASQGLNGQEEKI